MAEFTVHTLGCGCAKPSLRHNPACTVVEHRDNLFMIDCGEGTQKAFMRQRLRPNRLRHVFLTHLHGDHVLGLPGFLSTLSLGEAGGDITIHTFAEGERIIRTMMDFFAPHLTFDLRFNIISPDGGETVFENRSLSVRTVRLDHRVPCVGYVFEERPKPRHLNRAMCDFHGVPVSRFNLIKGGADFIKPDGTVVANAALTTPPTPALSYAHLSDTAFMPGLGEAVGPVTLMFHETTYLEKDAHLAAQRGHSTARQAAETARRAGAAALLTGHYSSRYRDEEAFTREASALFPRVLPNTEGLRTDLTQL